MERFNPFSSELDSDPFTTSFNRSSELPAANNNSNNNNNNNNNNNTSSSSSSIRANNREEMDNDSKMENSNSAASKQSDDELASSRQPPVDIASSRYTTSFPDPFGDLPIVESTTTAPASNRHSAQAAMSSTTVGSGGNRSNSVTFAPLSSHSVDDAISSHHSPGGTTRRTGGGPRQRSETGAFSSFLSRATSVTGSSVTDRVSGAVGTVRSAVDSISSQIQQAVPTNLIGGEPATQSPTSQQQQQQSAASYLASKLSSATGQFTSVGQSQSSMPVISRQRVVLILDSLADTDWALQLTNYRRLIAGLAPLNANQSALSSFFSQATAQLSSSASASASNVDGDLIEQVDFRNISILANQSSSTATVFVGSAQQLDPLAMPLNSQQQQSPLQNQPLIRSNSSKLQQQIRIIRPEYVVVRQNTRQQEKQDDRLKLIVNALNYCLVPLFEPIEVWNCFQDRQLLFSKLLRIQKYLGRENFPLIPQVYCQTHQDLLNYINGSTVHMPCLVRIGPTGRGKIRIDNQQMLRDFSTIMATSGLSCTVEPYLEVDYDLVIQKLGTNLKSFKRTVSRKSQYSSTGLASDGESRKALMSDGSYGSAESTRQSAFRQTSLGSSMLSSLIASGSGGGSGSSSSSQQQLNQSRRSSNPANLAYEKVSEVNVRYRTWLEAVKREFDNKIEAFCIKVVVTSDDREYIVGMRDCSMDFLGTLDNQDEDKRSFVELIISHMNTHLPKHSSVSRETSLTESNTIQANESSDPTLRRTTSDEKSKSNQNQDGLANLSGGERRKFTSQSQINGDPPSNRSSGAGLGSRSQSVSVNQSDFLMKDPVSKPYFNRRGSELSDSSLTDSEVANSTSMGSNTTSSGGLHQRQSSMGQSFFDQTSTALSSFQKQSMSFFKRFDAQASGSNTPPQSAKSDRSFPLPSTVGERGVLSTGSVGSAPATAAAAGGGGGGATSVGSLVSRGNGFKSQSMDTPDFNHNYGSKSQFSKKATPPKPPPPAPQSLVNRQSSLAASTYSGSRNPATTPHSTPAQTRQNSTVSEGNQQQRNRVVRQNSALSAFEPFDQELAEASAREPAPSPVAVSSQQQQQHQVDPSGLNQAVAAIAVDKPRRPSESATKKSGNFDSASITSGDSNSTAETITGEDTMNNLKKTFASIFGDKCD